jgi:hypothetical protein
MRELGSVLQATPLCRYEGALWRKFMLRVDLRCGQRDVSITSRHGPALVGFRVRLPEREHPATLSERHIRGLICFWLRLLIWLYRI